MNKSLKSLLLIPNLIGYIRLLLLLWSWINWDRPTVFLFYFILSAALDFIDGVVARRLGQTSEFGAWLDVVIDNISRSMIWTGIFPSFGFLISSLEWLTFVCTHQLGEGWKAPDERQPTYVSSIMANNFNTPLGSWVIISIWFLPPWMYALKYYEMTLSWYNIAISAVFITGRLAGFMVESWFILQHVLFLLED